MLLATCLPNIADAGPKTRVPITSKRSAKCEYNKDKKSWQRAGRRKKREDANRRVSTTSFSKKANQTCKTLVPPGTVNELNKIPPLYTFLKSRPSFFGRDASGTPPTLIEIQESSIENLFWREGVIERIINETATEEDCEEFYQSEIDGGSSGFAGCYLAQESGRAIESLLSSAISVCYLRSIPTLTIGRAVTIDKGEGLLPKGKFSKIFSAPQADERRTVVMQVKGFPDEIPEQEALNSDEIEQYIYVRPHNRKKIKKQGDRGQYGYDLFFCNADRGLEGVEVGTIGREGKIRIESSGSGEDEVYNTDVTGYLMKNEDGTNSILYNTNLPREARISFRMLNDTFSEKAHLLIGKNNIIRSKIYLTDLFDQQLTRRSTYSVLEFSGTGAGDMAFRQGAYKETSDDSEFDDYTVGVEFREDRYLSAPEGEFVELLEEVNLQTDAFYTPDTGTFDDEQFDCTTEADIVLTIDFSHPDMQGIIASCEANTLRNMDFCFENEQLREAEMKYYNVCYSDEEFF